jgi:glyoxylase-like metal-dependent hydrolase (beta-lactamase superfamily II)
MTQKPDVQAFFDTRTATVTYLVADPATKVAVIIDPVLDFDPKCGRLWTQSIDAVLAAAAERGLTVERVLETHAHADHLSAAQTVKRRTGARVGAGARIVEVQRTFGPKFAAQDVAQGGADFDDLFTDEARFRLGGLEVRVLSTPGHTPACVTYVIGDSAFVGDTLFMPDFGSARCDFPGGDAVSLFRSVRRILELPPETRMFVGHDYPSGAGREAAQWQTTVGAQRAGNKHLKDGITEADFVAMRTQRDSGLDAPVLLLPALQVNIRAGRLPPATDEGQVFLRIPVTAEAAG